MRYVPCFISIFSFFAVQLFLTHFIFFADTDTRMVLVGFCGIGLGWGIEAQPAPRGRRGAPHG
jgi:hypothetical protein